MEMPRPVSVTYQVCKSKDELTNTGAQRMGAAAVDAVKARGVARFALSGGNSPLPMFALLADRSAPYFAQMPWDKLQLFWVDERCRPPTNPQSNYGATRK